MGFMDLRGSGGDGVTKKRNTKLKMENARKTKDAKG